MPETGDCGADAAAYVLGALEPMEAERFRLHMESCAICRAEVDSLEQIVGELPSSAHQHRAPKTLRRRVMAEVQADARADRRARPGRHRIQGMVLAPVVSLTVAVLAVVGIEITSTAGTAVYAASVGDAQVRVTNGHAELVVHKLPLPRGSRIYEVWLQHRHGAPQPTTALFSVTASGDGSVDVPGNLHGVREVLVTQERAGGAKHPTSQPVIVAPID